MGGTRTFPPFQGNGGGPSGGPILTLKGREVDLFIHLTAVRPGTVLEVGDAFALAGAVGPPLPAVVSYTVTKPSGSTVNFSGRANRVGYYYHPEHDIIVNEPGVYTVDLSVTYDGQTSAGQVTEPFPNGDVLGSASGRFFIYVVPRGSARLSVNLPESEFLTTPVQHDFIAEAPEGMTLEEGHVTVMMPGFLLETKDLTVSSRQLFFSYDSVALAQDFPNLDVTSEAADVITVSLFALGEGSNGQPDFAARVLVLHGDSPCCSYAMGMAMT